MLWQFVQETSLRECLPDSQNDSWRLPPWQVMQTALFSAGVPLPTGLAGFLAGSLRCSEASPWHAWHMLPEASFLAPWWVSAMEACAASWQVAQTGGSFCWAEAGNTIAAAAN